MPCGPVRPAAPGVDGAGAAGWDEPGLGVPPLEVSALEVPGAPELNAAGFEVRDDGFF
ncbi:hypothetical protein ACFFHJ_34370 [Planotetraspora thailandica]|uniref:hypothetical protein n=1 Tax=Planotetraspora thailandica TaxID=487172 RepID=UPI00194EFAD8|nr:hypothetical protein [Planotetraspora thailandica]